MIHRYYFLTES